jgi:inosine-uridine nucleoside N-ribohydrolase
VVLIAIGPLTNVALLYKLYPNISKKVKSLHIMGGNYLGVGNVSACAEFNFWSDPESAHIVFAESKCPITIFPWEPCIAAGDAMPFDDWRIKELAGNNNPYTNLLDPIEIKAYQNILPNWTPCDNFLASCFISRKMIKKSTIRHVTIELAGNHTRGQMVIDHLTKNPPNALVIEEIDVELFKKFMLWVCGHENSGFEF